MNPAFRSGTAITPRPTSGSPFGMIHIVGVGLALSLCSTLNPRDAGAQGSGTVQPPQIITSGTGEAQAQPDRATILFAVETRSTTAAEAASENARRQTAVLQALRAKGLTADQLATLGYSVQPDYKYENNEQRVVGYVARNTVRAEVSKLEQTGSLIDAALQAGANSVSGLRFFSSKYEDARRSALAASVAKARADAEVMAKAAGGSLGALLELTYGGAPTPMPYERTDMMAMRASQGAAPETPISPGDQTVTVTVSARWTYISAR